MSMFLLITHMSSLGKCLLISELFLLFLDKAILGRNKRRSTQLFTENCWELVKDRAGNLLIKASGLANVKMQRLGRST